MYYGGDYSDIMAEENLIAYKKIIKNNIGRQQKLNWQ
jgi:hypothetical protein